MFSDILHYMIITMMYDNALRERKIRFKMFKCLSNDFLFNI